MLYTYIVIAEEYGLKACRRVHELDVVLKETLWMKEASGQNYSLYRMK
jgi:hypothetical protein